jgi:hypothetical protein
VADRGLRRRLREPARQAARVAPGGGMLEDGQDARRAREASLRAPDRGARGSPLLWVTLVEPKSAPVPVDRPLHACDALIE